MKTFTHASLTVSWLKWFTLYMLTWILLAVCRQCGRQFSCTPIIRIWCQWLQFLMQPICSRCCCLLFYDSPLELTWPWSYKTWVQSQTQNRAQWLAASSQLQAANHCALFWVWEWTQGPELCRRSRFVLHIVTFVFPAFTLNPFFSMASFHNKSLLTHSSRESAMITRSSACISPSKTATLKKTENLFLRLIIA